MWDFSKAEIWSWTKHNCHSQWEISSWTKHNCHRQWEISSWTKQNCHRQWEISSWTKQNCRRQWDVGINMGTVVLSYQLRSTNISFADHTSCPFYIQAEAVERDWNLRPPCPASRYFVLVDGFLGDMVLSYPMKIPATRLSTKIGWKNPGIFSINQ